MHETKNTLMEWLSKRKATDVEMYCGEEGDDFDYYRNIDFFINHDLYSVDLMVFEGNEIIDYNENSEMHRNLTVDEFLSLLT